MKIPSITKSAGAAILTLGLFCSAQAYERSYNETTGYYSRYVEARAVMFALEDEIERKDHETANRMARSVCGNRSTVGTRDYSIKVNHSKVDWHYINKQKRFYGTVTYTVKCKGMPR